MSESCETIKVKAWDAEQGDHVVINKADFDPEKHELFEAPGDGEQAASGAKAPKAKKAAA